MLLKQTEQQTRSIGFDESIKGGIEQENLGFILRSLSKNLYQEPAGSIVREIACNGWDSTVGTSQTPVVLIRYDKAEHSISFVDKGVGMSKQFIETKYVNYGSSTKRESEEAIGFFGVGSKSPFALVDSFYIESIHEGVKLLYLYSFADGINTLPELDLLSEEATDEHSGTTIKFYLGDHSLNSFEWAIKDQLKYFDAVVLQGFSFDFQCDLYKGKNFIINPAYTKRLELCLGKVKYNLAYTEIGIDPDYRELPFALHFDLDSGLMPSPSRETIILNEESKKIILDKFNAAIEELEELWDQQRFTSSIGELQGKKHVSRRIKIGEFRIPVTFSKSTWEYKPSFPNHFKKLTEFGFNFDALDAPYLIWEPRTKAGNVGENRGITYYAKEFRVGKARYAKAKKVYYGFKTLTEKECYPLIKDFYSSDVLSATHDYQTKYNPELRKTEILVDKWKLHNPFNINFEQEINTFFEEHHKNVEKLRLLDEVKIEYEEYEPRPKNWVDEYYTVSSRDVQTIELESLAKFKYVVYLDRNCREGGNEHDNYTQWVNGFYSDYKSVSKGSVKHLVRFVACKKNDLKKLQQLPNFITLDDFKKTKLMQKFYLRVWETIRACDLWKDIKFTYENYQTRSFKQLLQQKRRGNNYFYSSFREHFDNDWFKTLQYWNNFNKDRKLKEHYKKQLQKLKK